MECSAESVDAQMTTPSVNDFVCVSSELVSSEIAPSGLSLTNIILIVVFSILGAVLLGLAIWRIVWVAKR